MFPSKFSSQQQQQKYAEKGSVYLLNSPNSALQSPTKKEEISFFKNPSFPYSPVIPLPFIPVSNYIDDNDDSDENTSSSDYSSSDDENEEENKRKRKRRKITKTQRQQTQERLRTQPLVVKKKPKWTYPHITLYILRKTTTVQSREDVESIGFSNFVRKIVKLAWKDEVFHSILVSKKPQLTQMEKKKRIKTLYDLFQLPIQQNLKGYKKSRFYEDERIILEKLTELYEQSKYYDPLSTIPEYQKRRQTQASEETKPKAIVTTAEPGTKAYALAHLGVAI